MKRRDAVRLIGSAAFLAPASALLAQPAPAAAGTLADDAALLGDVLTTLHPGLLRYLGPGDVAAGIARLAADFTQAPDLDGRYLALSRFLASIRCGHSYANFFNQKRAVRDALFDRPTRLPFAFRWLGERMVATADHGSGAVRPGDEIVSIGGVKASAMLARLMPYARADGHNDPKRRALLGVSGRETIDFFDVFHGLLYGAPAGGVHRLVLRHPDSRRSAVEVPALTLAQRQSFKPQPAAADGPLWTWTTTPAGVAVLTMDTWATYDTKWDWKTWLGDRLDGLRGTRGLVVDLRQNEGGEDCGDAILARFARHDVPLGRIRRLVRYRKTPARLDPVLDTWDDSFRDWGARARPYDARYFELVDEGSLVIPARGPRVEAPLVVLTSARNSSATFQFAQRARASGIATLVGETTGGNQRGINGGSFFFVRLPASGLEFDLPLVGTFPEAPMPDAGLRPDHFVAVAPGDLSAGRDPQMEAALALL